MKPENLLNRVVRFYNSDLWEMAGGDIGDNSCFWMFGTVNNIAHSIFADEITVDIGYFCPVDGKFKVSHGHFLHAIAYAKNLGVD